MDNTVFDYFREPKTPEEKKHREEMEAARLRRIHILKERSENQAMLEAQKREGEQARKQREERNAPKDVNLTNPRWIHVDETARLERPNQAYIGEKIILLVDQEYGDGKNIEFNIHDIKIQGKIDPNREVDEVKTKIDSPTPSVEWTILDPRSKKEKDREMQVYFYARCGKDFSENCFIELLERPPFTVADTVEILKAIESENGYHAARFFASHLNYEVLSEMAKTAEEIPDNNPNLMPTRFMLLPGADDSKLSETDLHPDNFEGAEDHTINVINLQKGLNLLGEEVPADGIFDNKTEEAFLRFLEKQAGVKPPVSEKKHIVEDGEDLGSIAEMYGMTSWKYLYELNKETVGENPDLLSAETELIIPGTESTSGDEMITEKGYRAEDYIGGIRYHYVWVPFSLSILDEHETPLENEEPMEFSLIDLEQECELLKITAANYDEIKTLIPSCNEIDIRSEDLFFLRG